MILRFVALQSSINSFLKRIAYRKEIMILVFSLMVLISYSEGYVLSPYHDLKMDEKVSVYSFFEFVV